MQDYIHVMDLADGHTAACDKLFASPGIGCIAYNLGTGTGTSVLEMIKVCTPSCADGGVSSQWGRLQHYYLHDQPMLEALTMLALMSMPAQA